MGFNDNTRATVKRWTEYRTPSGRWSKIKHGLQEYEYDKAQLCNFFSWWLKGQRVQRAHFREGCLPYRVTVPSPDGTMRSVTMFEYYTVEGE